MLIQRLYTLFFVALMFLAAACNKGEDKTPQMMLAGEDSKAWRTTEEISGTGTRQRLQKEDQNEILRFYSNGTFTVNTKQEHGNGTWFYDEGTKTLTLQFQGAEQTETFEVVDLSEQELHLRAADKSERILEAEKS